MTRMPSGFGGRRYDCPGCGVRVLMGQPHKRLATFTAHRECVVHCGICEEVIETPPIGRATLVDIYLNTPVHTRCKEKQ